MYFCQTNSSTTYVTQWTYDSHNRLLEMIYPDEEKITYSYNLGGQLEKVHGYKSYGYDYVSKIGYNKFEQRTYLKYCNGAETFYTYDPQRRRLQNLTVNSGGNTIMDNAYTYDANSKYINKKNKHSHKKEIAAKSREPICPTITVSDSWTKNKPNWDIIRGIDNFNIDFIESQFIQINGWHYTIVYIFLDLKVYYY